MLVLWLIIPISRRIQTPLFQPSMLLRLSLPLWPKSLSIMVWVSRISLSWICLDSCNWSYCLSETTVSVMWMKWRWLDWVSWRVWRLERTVSSMLHWSWRVFLFTVSDWLDMPSLKTLLFGGGAFRDCSRVVFESDWLWCEWLNRLAWIDFHSNGLWCISVQRWRIKHIDNAK